MSMQLEALAISDDLPPDTRLLGGQIVIDVRIGRGGAATVYAATTADGQEVAVKIMSAAYAQNPSARQRFRNEVATALHLADHPGVVTPYGIGELPELDGRPYITMPLIKGCPLVFLIGQLPVVEAVVLVRDLARIVDDVHARGIIHRDVKPGNVIVGSGSRDRVPYLIDFGLAYGTGAANAPVTAGLTAAHELPGTKHYMAPEQILGATPDPRFDVYALGVTLYEVLSGVVPLNELSATEAARRKCDASLPSLSIAGKVRGLPEALERVIDAALERDPQRRTPTAGRLAEQLTEGLEALGRRRSAPRIVAVDGGAVATERPTQPDVGSVVPPPPEAPAVGPARAEGWLGRWVPWGAAAAVVLGAGLWLTLGAPSGLEAASDEVLGIAGSSAGLIDAGGTAEVEPGGTVEVPPQPEPQGETIEPEESDPGPDVEPEPERIVEPEPERIVEPEPEHIVEPEPAPERKSKPRRKPQPSDEAPCPDVATEAQAAKRQRNWERVRELTSSARCWTDDVRRVRLHVEALVELRRYRECAAFRPRTRNAEVIRLIKTCASQVDEEHSK